MTHDTPLITIFKMFFQSPPKNFLLGEMHLDPSISQSLPAQILCIALSVFKPSLHTFKIFTTKKKRKLIIIIEVFSSTKRSIFCLFFINISSIFIISQNGLEYKNLFATLFLGKDGSEIKILFITYYG